MYFNSLPLWSENILCSFFKSHEYCLMGERMVYRGEGAMFAGKEGECYSC